MREPIRAERPRPTIISSPTLLELGLLIGAGILLAHWRHAPNLRLQAGGHVASFH